MMPIQIIGASAEHKRVAAFAEAVRAIPGIDIRFAWFASDPESWTGKDAETSDRDAAVVAELNRAALHEAQLVIHLAPEAHSIGAAWEYGYAIGIGRLVWSVGPMCRATIHRAHRHITLIGTDAEAVEMLRAAAAARLLAGAV